MDLKDTLKAFIEEGADWERKQTTVPGVSIIRLPATKNRAASLAIDINPVGDNGLPMKKKGIMIMNSAELAAFPAKPSRTRKLTALLQRLKISFRRGRAQENPRDLKFFSCEQKRRPELIRRPPIERWGGAPALSQRDGSAAVLETGHLRQQPTTGYPRSGGIAGSDDHLFLPDNRAAVVSSRRINSGDSPQPDRSRPDILYHLHAEWTTPPGPAGGSHRDLDPVPGKNREC